MFNTSSKIVILEKESEIAKLSGSKKTKVAKTIPAAKNALETRLLREMKNVLRNDIIHWLTNQPKHWEVYTDSEDGMCNIIMSQMNRWPATYVAEDKESMWNRFLGPNLNRAWSVKKNEVLQRVKTLFLSKFRENLSIEIY